MPPNPQPAPPPFPIDPSNPVPPLHPYNKLTNSTPSASSGLTAAAGASASQSGSGQGPAKSPEIRGGSGLRPYYAGGLPERDRASVAQRDAPKAFGYPASSPSTTLNRPSDSPSSAPASHSHSHSTLPHHHHHHRHAVHTHTPASTASTAGTSTPAAAASREPERKPAASTTPSTLANPLGSGLGAMSRYGSGYGLFGGIREAELRERERQRERQRAELERTEREAKEVKAVGATSPTARTTGTAGLSPFARPSMPPSPTTSRSLNAPGSASGTGAAVKPSASPQPQPGATNSSASRPNLPLSGYNSMGARGLPSPFEKERSTSTSATDNQANPSGHHRSLSNSSNRGDALSGTAGLSQTSPRKPAGAPQPSAPARSGMFGGPPPLAQPRDGPSPSDPKRSPVASPSTSAKPASAAASSAASTSGRAGYPSYSYGGPSYMGFGLGGYGGLGWSEKERERQRMLERERQREMQMSQASVRKVLRERDERLEKERLERERERERKLGSEGQRQTIWGNISTTTAEIKPFVPPRSGSYDLFGRAKPVDPPSAPASSSATASGPARIEVLNTPAAERAPPASMAQYPGQTSGSVIEQVAPSREPRPYTYSAKVDPPAPQQPKDREYHYTPRDKRPRMDAAVEEQAHRRGSSSKSKRRKEEVRSPPPAPPRPVNFAELTKEIKQWPEVKSFPVETWLQNPPEPMGILSRQLYTGADWTMAKAGCTKLECEGGVVVVRINSSFLGDGWKLRGESGWDEASPASAAQYEIGRNWEKRKAWGTDVYTDDSDVGLVLVHAGWVRWSSEKEAGTAADKKSRDVIEVTIRVVPKLVRYTATERNGLVTRSWGNGHDGASIVVENVERIEIPKTISKSKASRKLRMAEVARQRTAVMESTPTCESARAVKDALEYPGLASCDGGFGYSFNPKVLALYADFPWHEVCDTLWHQVLTVSGPTESHNIMISDQTTSVDDLKIIIRKRGPDDKDFKLWGSKEWDGMGDTLIDLRDIHWVKDGLITRGPSNQGHFYPVRGFTWAERRAGFTRIPYVSLPSAFERHYD